MNNSNNNLQNEAWEGDNRSGQSIQYSNSITNFKSIVISYLNIKNRMERIM